MSQARVTIAYDGPALKGGMMDVRDLAQALWLIEQPLRKEGIDSFEVRDKQPVITASKHEAGYFARPEMPDETIVDVSSRAAYSIVSLAFKEDNRWRLNDGNDVISVSITD